jgi:hypothetical protein
LPSTAIKPKAGRAWMWDWWTLCSSEIRAIACTANLGGRGSYRAEARSKTRLGWSLALPAGPTCESPGGEIVSQPELWPFPPSRGGCHSARRSGILLPLPVFRERVLCGTAAPGCVPPRGGNAFRPSGRTQRRAAVPQNNPHPARSRAVAQSARFSRRTGRGKEVTRIRELP